MIGKAWENLPHAGCLDKALVEVMHLVINPVNVCG